MRDHNFQGTTRDFTYQTLKDRILSLELKPGTKISEKEIAEKFKVSRTPVRESFLTLAQEGLLDIYPQSGTIVSRIDLKEAEEGRFVREKLERAIVVEACNHFSDDDLFSLESNIVMQQILAEKDNYTRLFELDEDFHKTLFKGCGKLRTWKMIQQMNNQFKRLRLLRLFSNSDWDLLISQHAELVECIKQKEAEKADKIMESHLQLIVFEKQELKEQYPNYFNS